MVLSSKPGLRRKLVGPSATVVVVLAVLAAVVEGSELEVVSKSEVVSLSVVVYWGKIVVKVSVPATDVLIQTVVESAESLLLVGKIEEACMVMPTRVGTAIQPMHQDLPRTLS
jgi:hypothetical protein